MQASKTRRQLQAITRVGRAGPGKGQPSQPTIRPTTASSPRRGTLSAADGSDRALYTKLIDLLGVVIEEDVLSSYGLRP